MNIFRAFVSTVLALFTCGLPAAEVRLVESLPKPSFPLVTAGTTAHIVLQPAAPEVVKIAARDLADDITAITGKPPQVIETPRSGPKVILRIKDIGRWEAFRISATPETLTIDGNDPRGLAFGIYELSRRIGVSPWHWWADVPVTKLEELHLSVGTDPIEQPAVKYRGIFLNDEGWGLRPWAAKTFEPEVGNIGPKTYSKIFELLLRLRANTIWPAMHPGTTPFHQIPENTAAADRYAIVTGSSHAEPMLRNNVGEWKRDGRKFNYLTNRDDVRHYWEDRVKQRTSGESIFTIGMRGIHDSPIVGPKSQNERITTLTEIFTDQRAMLARHLGNGDPTRVPQMFCPYKEVLSDYLAGLKIPDDVTIVWPDDNFGYVRRFGTAAERKRNGGLGVYYHASYLGAPLSWLWIDTLPPALVWSEMTRAYEQGARNIWIVNVGDIKNTERSMEFFLDLAWNADRTDPAAPARFLLETAARDFGTEHAAGIADILSRLQAISFARKTEHLQWHISLNPYQPTGLNESEIRDRLAACELLANDCETIANRLPPDAADAFYQLVGFPAAITAAANERYFRSELARADIARGRPPEPNQTAAAEAAKRIDRLNARYNEGIAGGKWQHAVTVQGVSAKDWIRFQPDAKMNAPTPAEDNICPPAPPAVSPLNTPADARPGDFVERDGVVSIDAGHFTSKSDTPDGAGWRSIQGLGRTGSAVTVLPSTTDWKDAPAPHLVYRFHTNTGGSAKLRVRLLPTHPITEGTGLRFAIGTDGGKPVPLALTHGFEPKSSSWNDRVLANATHTTADLPAKLAPGWHTLELHAVDPGVVVDKIVLAFGDLPPSYDGPSETRVPSPQP